MGANAQTSVPAFTSGQVLTASQVTQINTGIPVFASSTERDAAFGGAGEKTLAEGQMAYLEDTNETQVYDGSAWTAVGGGGGLVLLDQTTVGSAVSSVDISSVFSSTYDNYLVIIAGVIGSANVDMNVRFGASGTFVTTGYYGAQRNITYAGSLSNTLKNNGSSLAIGEISSGRNDMGISMWIYSPNISDETAIGGTHSSSGNGGYFQGMEIGVNVHTDFRLFPQSGTITGGTVTTYGVVKS